MPITRRTPEEARAYQQGYAAAVDSCLDKIEDLQHRIELASQLVRRTAHTILND